MNRELKEAYDVLRKKVPLSFDCGKLCDAACCKGDCDTGMELFPGEEELFANEPGFTVKHTGDGRAVLICQGSCDRNIRPLSCRIYPLFPLVYEQDGRDVLEVIYDPRSKGCPLGRAKQGVSRNFTAAVRRAGLYLCRDKECRQYLKDTSELLIEIIKLEQLMK